ncbi:hypothetical protein SDC9_07184 [bioreactor metagenome]|uniref:DUF3631 domain-containing protein n=3 Tax=root TaxID=1 RepID=D2BJ97_DEHMV|nr:MULTISPECIES: DUF3631 domain-containing protein [Dehalococcoides]ACZ62397.1 hypothetical protein DhcVS_1298 [Dehalococcoides mccartyi VS]AGG08448.1 hypothetical protein btf_1383 [Dehalococcoides mccartyi BTF08]AMU87160.1 Toprim sub domain-containing protein [Dehalococcoides mccartyi]WRX71660.1 hypothetical protein [Dehalococcoides mccartyi]
MKSTPIILFNIDDFLSRLPDARKVRDNHWVASCPVEGHSTPQNHLSITDVGDKVLLTCFSNRNHSYQQICQALGLKSDSQPTEFKRCIDSLYAYKDRDGNLLYQVVRYKPKSFAQRRPDGRGGWIYNLKGITPVLYRLPELLATPQDHVIFIAEGEKGANSLVEHGLNATCSPMGAGKWREEYNSAFTNRSLVILPDNDEPGENHAQQVFDSLSKVTPTIQILHLPGLREKEDVFDWFAQGHTAEELLELVELIPSQSDLDLAVLLDDIASFIRSYVILNEYQLQAISLWVLHTYTLENALTTPYLNIYSAEKRSGKTRLLEVLEVLVARPWFTGRVTSAVLARKVDAECPTLLLDESDAAFKGEKEYSETLRGILNTGYRRGGKSSVCVGKGADISYKDLSTFCPKAIAGIGKLPGTLADRSIPIQLKRRNVNETVAKFHPRKITTEIQRLKERLVQCTSIGLSEIELIIPSELDDRAADCWEHLLIIAETAGNSWPEKARIAAIALMTGEVRQDDSLGIQLLTDIREITKDKSECISSADLIEALLKVDESPWSDLNGRSLNARRLAALLKTYGIHSQTIREGNRTFKGYQVADFQDAFNRYLSKNGLLSVTSVTDSFEPIVKCEPNSSVTNGPKEQNVTDNPQSYANRNVTDVTDKTLFIREIDKNELDDESESDTSCEVLDSWRKTAIPAWRRVLKESISQGDIKREEYARKMLQEVLKDPAYREVQP